MVKQKPKPPKFPDRARTVPEAMLHAERLIKQGKAGPQTTRQWWKIWK